MKQWVAEALAKEAEDLGIEVEIRIDYSGRGMYGKETVGVVVDNPLTLIHLAANVVAGLSEAREEDPEATDKMRAFSKELTGLRMDSMGTQTIVY